MVIGRFQVMAVLQAARAFVLGLPPDLALSWGLNRAIFYAAAKKGFKGPPPPRRSLESIREKPITEAPDLYYLGDEAAYKMVIGGRTYFAIGGRPQTVEDFDAQIAARFGGAFRRVWEEAIELLQQFDRDTLLSQKSFYEKVYRPLRDELATRWSRFIS
ncbi:MAG: hypothetical protein QXI39_06550 [Candidatus Bathyarchaeia archaeon]